MVKKNNLKWYLIVFVCIFVTFAGFVKINIECNKRNEQIIENMKKNNALNIDLKDEYKKLYSIQDNSSIKIFYKKNPFNLKILIKEYEIAINAQAFKEGVQNLENQIKSIPKYFNKNTYGNK